VNHEDTTLGEIRLTQRTALLRYHFPEVPRAVGFLETESTGVGTGMGVGRWCVMGTEFQSGKVMQMDVVVVG
jgi:hypothetical protein